MENNFKLRAKKTQKPFMEIAKNLIIKGGTSSVSIEKISDIAGCSLETVYIHFKNLDELLWHTRNSMVDELLEMMFKNRSAFKELNDMKALYKDYIDFCVANPNYYRFFFFHKIDTSPKEFTDKLSMRLAKEFSRTFYKLQDNCSIGFDEILEINNALLYTTHGLLTVYLSGNFEYAKNDVYAGIDNIAEMILVDR